MESIYLVLNFCKQVVSFFFYRSPEMIMMCLIMDAHPSEDVSVHIQHTLIEAYCFEQDIHLLLLLSPCIVFIITVMLLVKLNTKSMVLT
jgi:hypothetical protein